LNELPDPWKARATHIVLDSLLHRWGLFRPDRGELVELPEGEEPDVRADLCARWISIDRVQESTSAQVEAFAEGLFC
jgi:hypothetical protein